MINIPGLFILLLCSIVSFGQEIQFYDVDGNRINKIQFEEQLDHKVNLAVSIQKGRIVETRLIPRIQTGILPHATHKAILTNLSEVSGKIIDSSNLVIINYSQGRAPNDSTLEPDSKVQKQFYTLYLQRVKRLKRVTQFFVNAKSKEFEYPENVRKWYPDKESLIERTFFNYFFYSGSFILINENGEYYVFFGEYSPDQVISEAKKLLKN